ncbi:MAG TPA: type 4a pilus biogenesis protein PilO [Mycobacteriales bacterium]|nr:type 4a pilus biogenesis protein PilO [Mycobacteriales bacterium]
MRGVRSDRLWIVGGALVAAILLAAGWFLAIGPQRAQTDTLNGQAATADLRLTSLHQKLVELRDRNARLPEFKAELAKDQHALPTTSGLSDFLRELQAGGDVAGVVVSGVVVGSPQEVTAAAAKMYALPVTLTVAGTTTGLASFLNQLQRVRPRAVLVNNVIAAPAEPNLDLSGRVTLTVGVQVFVAAADRSSSGTPPGTGTAPN